MNSPIELPEVNAINFASDFALLEHYDPTNMFAVYVLIGLLVLFVGLCCCAHQWQRKRYKEALKTFEFVHYRAGPQDFEGDQIPVDVSRGMFMLDASLHLQEAAKLQRQQKNEQESQLIHNIHCIFRCCCCCCSVQYKNQAQTKMYLFLTTYREKLLEDHSWMSIVTLPDAHPFTPVQRLWVVWIMTLTNFAVIGLFFGKLKRPK